METWTRASDNDSKSGPRWSEEALLSTWTVFFVRPERNRENGNLIDGLEALRVELLGKSEIGVCLSSREVAAQEKHTERESEESSGRDDPMDHQGDLRQIEAMT